MIVKKKAYLKEKKLISHKKFGDELLVDGIRLTDVDLDLDKVVVRVSSDSGGTMTLNSEYKEKADFLR